MQAFYSDQFVLPLPEGHRFPMAKYRMLREQLCLHLPEAQCMPAPRASDGELAYAHSPAVIRGIGFPWSETMTEWARRSVGATITAARCALTDGVAANLAGGTHHSYADKGGGFCAFNDVAVARRVVHAECGRSQARGTAPLSVAVIDLDVALPGGCADAQYLACADAYAGDRLGRLKLNMAGMQARDQRVFDWCSSIPTGWRWPIGSGKIFVSIKYASSPRP